MIASPTAQENQADLYLQNIHKFSEGTLAWLTTLEYLENLPEPSQLTGDQHH